QVPIEIFFITALLLFSLLYLFLRFLVIADVRITLGIPHVRPEVAERDEGLRAGVLEGHAPDRRIVGDEHLVLGHLPVPDHDGGLDLVSADPSLTLARYAARRAGRP